ncbi:hypothetical protein RRF57_007398 [Xylaria bambusicola]|uniref:Ubiquitin-like protease family profile domain-containing protein n=1 Tax=Xylaria bambusicola TaxID=326684 RepID=A0AAN7V0J8_9PEZI
MKLRSTVEKSLEETQKTHLYFSVTKLGIESKTSAKMVLPVRTVMNRTNILEPVNGTIRIRDRWPRKDKYKGPPDLPEDFTSSIKVSRYLNALQVLQLQRHQYLSWEALAIPLQYLHNSLPYMVQRDVNVLPPVQNDIWSYAVHGKYPSVRDDMDAFVEKYKKALTSRPYQFWPIDISLPHGVEPPHWILIVLHLARDKGEDVDPNTPDYELKGPLNLVESYAVINPDHGNYARDMEDDVAAFLETLLPRFDVQVYPPGVRQNPWVPPRYVTLSMLLNKQLLTKYQVLLVNAPQLTPTDSKEYWSSGLRVFEMARIWFERITELYCQSPHRHNPEKFWASHPGWINLDAVRSNMIGMAATLVNTAMNSTTRIAIEPILDNSMKHVSDNRTVLTQTMLPTRTGQGSFIPDQPRQNPTLIHDIPFLVVEQQEGNDIKEEESPTRDIKEEDVDVKDEEEEDDGGKKAGAYAVYVS